MCHFISAILPTGADEEAVRAVMDRFARNLDPQECKSATARLKPGERLYGTTRAHCDCGTALGTMAPTKTSKPGPFEKGLRKRRKKGWSEAKLQAWLEQAHKTEAKNERARQAQGLEAMPDAQAWLELLRELLTSGLTSRIGLLLYWVDPDWPMIGSEERVRVPLDALDTDVLLRMEEDRIYEFI